jgi:hypothetical protein
VADGEEHLMEIIGAGFGRTGTMSLKVALEQLGYGPCYHMVELFEHPEHVEQWEAAVRGEPVAWEDMFAGYLATVDWPGAAFYKELMEAHPEARVLLSVRDPHRWYESTKNTIYATVNPSPEMIAAVGPAPRLNNELIWKRTFGENFEDRQHAIEVFERHNEEVKEHVPADQLLVYEVKEGWEPLCDFLGIETPKGKPFPHLNDTDSFQRMVREHSAQRD